MLWRAKDTQEAPSHGASFSFWKGGEHRAGVVSFGIMLLGGIAGLVITLLVALMIPGLQPWLIIAGAVLGGFIALQWRRTH